MNREILFRGKRVDNGEWVYGYLFKWPMRGWKLLSTAIVPIDSLENGIAEQVEVGPDTVGQYTGLTDAEGKRIFENDVLSHVNTRWNDEGDIEEYITYCVVKYGTFNCTCCYGVYGWYFDDEDIRRVKEYTVVGNIFDNADLIRKG